MFRLALLLLFSVVSAEVSDYLYVPTADVALDLQEYRVYSIEPHGSYYIDNPKDCLKNRIVNGIVDEPEVLNKVLALTKPGMTVVDVGAHIGTYSVPIAKKLGDRGKLFCFEPQKKLFCELAYNLDLNSCKGVKIVDVALGDKRRMVHMHRPIKNNEGGGFIGKGGETVEMLPLDAFDFGRIDLIKIDVENSEHLVIMGAKQTILRDRPTIVMEVGGNRRKRAFDRISAHTHHNRVMQLMHDLGYEGANLSWKNFIFTPKEKSNG